MKFAVQTVVALSLVLASPVFAAVPARPVPAAAANAAHVQAVQELLGAMQAEKMLRGVAARSGYQSAAQRQAVFAKLDKVPAAEVYRRLAPSLVQHISADTAAEMTRFYNTPYGKQVIHGRYNRGAQVELPGAQPVVAPEERKARKRAAYVLASKALEDAQPMVEREAFKLLQTINREKR